MTYFLFIEPCGDGSNVAKERLIEVQVFYRHFVFVEDKDGNRKVAREMFYYNPDMIISFGENIIDYHA